MNEITARDHGIHLPPKSIWPLILALGIGFLTFGVIFIASSRPIFAELSFIVGGSVTVVSLMGWAHSVVKEKAEPGEEARAVQQKDLLMFLKYFLISEAAIFGALFVHYYNNRFGQEYWPLAGSPEIHTTLPAVATLILMFSSLTCEIGHLALKKGRRFRSKTFILITAVLGLIFLGFQGYEWGLLINQYSFTAETNIYGTLFYMLTGFHGLHVSVGILFLILVYGRLEMGQMDQKRHFSMIAATWYWHFVDVIWILLFFSIYLI
ncbi:MAG TPA: heme-copper oxidase subunit III [candidate division Zixibacteria bacterium]|nr:heme-copper oxidase subunit III [candidate division Zixibacteria bacterium]HEQ99386.1 heme-copper oxidase subunit III [candidate division Zixibacteria bacterium]